MYVISNSRAKLSNCEQKAKRILIKMQISPFYAFRIRNLITFLAYHKKKCYLCLRFLVFWDYE